MLPGKVTHIMALQFLLCIYIIYHIYYYVLNYLLSSCSVSLLLTTTEATVVENPDKNKPPGRVPDMDDLDY